MIRELRPFFDRTDPFVAMSRSSTHVFKTGSQASTNPNFINRVAPCRSACPIGINIPEAIQKASLGDLEGALRVILEENPLPGICGRVCYHPCEMSCNRKDFDEPINVREFERFVSDHVRVDINRAPLQNQRVAVVGSGPAGLSAAYHLAKIGYGVTLFEARPELGGMLRYGIPEYRLPKIILDREIERIISLGVTAQRDRKSVV